MKIEVTTPPIPPAPERLHLLLLVFGKGIAWFDDGITSRLQLLLPG